ncbi:MAG: aldehyde dehydrogenase family protein [Neisseriaceae bacterium]|nr:aldehyde dehydrogenase family protein [Neisseriaceae bacterium]
MGIFTEQPHLFINGQATAPADGFFDVINPATGAVFAQAPQASLGQLDEAVAGAQKALPAWGALSYAERGAVLLDIAAAIEARSAELAKLITLEQGKPLAVAEGEVQGTLAWIRYTAAQDLPVEVLEDSPHKRIELHRKPIGVVGSITPWNWPVMIATWHIFPALQCGNAVINKPSELTPLSTLLLAQIISDHVPAGVFSVVCGAGALGGAMSGHKGIDKIVFTGSTATGQKIMVSAAETLKKLTLELGGNDAAIVLPDANVAEIAPKIFATAFINGGQTCAAIKRLYVHQDLVAPLSQALADIAKQQIVGPGLDPSTTFGPVQNKAQYDKVKGLIDAAVAAGGEILSGAQTFTEPGYYIQPTVVVNVDDHHSVVTEEQFGPVLPVLAYTDIDDAIQRANALSVGLGASVWGSDMAIMHQVADQLEAGTVWLNNHAELAPHAPFGGWKLSGIGVEFGLDGLKANTIVQTKQISR